MKVKMIACHVFFRFKILYLSCAFSFFLITRYKLSVLLSVKNKLSVLGVTISDPQNGKFKIFDKLQHIKICIFF